MAEERTRLTITEPGDRDVRVERTFDAPPELVWRALTEAPLLARWWARGNPVSVERFEPVPGGHWRLVEHAPDGDYGFEGRFRELHPPDRISQTFEWDGQPGHVSVDTIQLERTDGGRTRMVSTSMFMTAEDKAGMMGEGMTDGMALSYAALDEVLASLR